MIHTNEGRKTMEEKRYLKIRVGTIILIGIILALIIALIGMYCYYSPRISEKSATNQETPIANMKNPNNELNTNLNDKNTTQKENTEKNKTEENKLSDTDVDRLVKGLFEDGSEKIRELKYAEFFDEYGESSPRVEKSINGRRYIKTDKSYEDIEKEYEELFTDEALENVLSERFANIDGDLYVSVGGATGWCITQLELTRTFESNDEIEYVAKYRDVHLGGLSDEQSECKITVKLVDGSYRISSTDYCDMDKND